jgi:acyl-CoA synthetase (AMP-forming)/AMP-acid ligase II
MLYERWQRVARERGHEIALQDLASGQQWTFERLAQLPVGRQHRRGEVHFLEGRNVAFIFAVLEAWRTDGIVCPLETGQIPPSLARPPEKIVHLKTTSATTGQARLVALTAEQLAADADNIARTMGLRPDWPNLGLISLAHSYGFSNLVLPLLLLGIPLWLLDSALPEALRRAASSLSDLTLPAVPALWRTWHETGAIPSSVRLAISAGAPLPLSLEEELFAKSGLKIHNFYGASECGGIAYDGSATPRAQGECVGAPLENVELSVNDEGCLEVRSPAVAQTYWPEPDAALGCGCYRTSDLAELKAGLVFLRGRASDQINVAGRKVFPEAIESVLAGHPQVRDCLVFGALGAGGAADRSEFVVACVVKNSEVTSECLRQFLLTRLPAWQVPREWRFLESLAPNQRGKLSRAEWRTRLGFAPPK